MKKFALLILALLIATAPIYSVLAEEKTVDGSSERWEQESTVNETLAEMTWDQSADTLNFKGTGYRDRVGLKFGFRCKIAFDMNDISITLKFPETFNALYTPSNNMHFVVGLVNTYSRWWNTDSNEIKSAAFIIRPQAQDLISVELAGRWAQGSRGYGDISGVLKTDFALNESREMSFGFKKEGEVYNAYVNGEKFATLDKELVDSMGKPTGKTMSDYFSTFADDKGYLQFGATVENDPDKVEISYTITKMVGALDAFKEPELPPETDVNDEPLPTTVQPDNMHKSNFNYNYIILYGIAGIFGICAVVLFVISKKK